MEARFPFVAVLLAGLCLLGFTGHAQTQECGTDAHLQELQSQHPDLLHLREQYQAQLRKYLAANPETGTQKNSVKLIPVVVHIITESGGGGLTKAEIEQGIAFMNDDYRRLNADTSQVRIQFKPLIADSEIEFRLAKLDPDGNCTEGIVRIASPLTNNANPANLVKTLSYWPADKYFNIWLVNSASVGGAGTVNGYAQYPGTGSLNTYGVVCRIDRFGLSYTNGIRTRTLTHEVGHCLNLYHLHDYGCGTDCNYSGDEVCDTPPSNAGFFTCNPNLNTCNNDMDGAGAFTTDEKDQFENYMSYGDCRLLFTHGQKARMHATLDTYPFLQNLVSPANAIATGIVNAPAQVCTPIAAFSANKTKVCAGSAVQFTDLSYNATVDATWNWSWSFPGGTPTAASTQNPLVQYNVPGVYPVTLTATNQAGTDSVIQTNLITVWDATGETAPYAQSFEDAQFPQNAGNPAASWLIEGPTANAWLRNTNAAAIGSASVFINNKIIPYGSVNNLISPSIDLSGLNSPSLTFDLAYALTGNGANDNLKIYVSPDCGNSWILRYAKTGANLSTVGAQFIPNFVPAQPGQWRTETVNLGQSLALPNIRIKFEMTSAAGNALYLDNLNISGISGTEELASATVTLFPNPADDQVMLKLNLHKPATISCKLLDVTGREIRTLNFGPLQNGNSELPIHLNGLSQGVYTLQVTDGNSAVVRKLLKL